MMTTRVCFASLVASLAACGGTTTTESLDSLPTTSLWSHQNGAVFGWSSLSNEDRLAIRQVLTVFSDQRGVCAAIDLQAAGVPVGKPGVNIGTVQLERDGSVVLAPEFDSLEGAYFGSVPGNGPLDLTFSGSDAIDGATLPGILVPPSEPIITGTFDGNEQLALTNTITYEPVAADQLHFVFNFNEGGENVTFGCNADPAGSLDITDLRPRLALGGSFFVEAINIRLAPVSTETGDAAFVGQSIASKSIGFRNE